MLAWRVWDFAQGGENTYLQEPTGTEVVLVVLNFAFCIPVLCSVGIFTFVRPNGKHGKEKTKKTDFLSFWREIGYIIIGRFGQIRRRSKRGRRIKWRG